MLVTAMKNIYNKDIQLIDLDWEDFKMMAEYAPEMKEKGVNAVVGGKCTWKYDADKKAGGRQCLDRCIVILDADFPKERLLDKVYDYFFYDFGYEVKWGFYTTFSSTYEQDRFRILVELSRTVTPEEYKIIAEAIMHDLDDESFDPASSRPNQAMFLPCRPVRYDTDLEKWEADYYDYDFVEGESLDVDKFLTHIEKHKSYYAEYKPVTRTKDGEIKARPLYTRKKVLYADKIYTSNNTEDPRTKDSIVSTFTSIYSVQDVLEEILSDIYERVGRRYRLKDSKKPAGGMIIDDGLYFISYHSDNDAAYGAVRNAYDLVLVHLEEILTTSEEADLRRRYFIRRKKALKRYGDAVEDFYPEEPEMKHLMYDWAMKIPEVRNAEIKRIKQKNINKNK